MTLGAVLERGGRPGDEEASFPSLRLRSYGFGRILVCYTAVLSVFMQRSPPLTATQPFLVSSRNAPPANFRPAENFDRTFCSHGMV